MFKCFLLVIALLAFQVLYYWLTVIIIHALCNKLLQGVPNGYCLMVHHTIQFGIVFIPCIILHIKGILDFGFHIKNWKKGILYLLFAIVFELLLNIYTYLIWGGNDITMDNFLFQLLFSGLGEEIAYRSTPLVLFAFAYGENIEISFKRFKHKKIVIDIGILLSAILFMIGHININFSTWEISYSTVQLISAFVIGILLGHAYKKTNSVWFCMAMHGIVNAFISSEKTPTSIGGEYE